MKRNNAPIGDLDSATTTADLETAALYTIGHSNHSLDTFLAILNQHQIAALADVRSQPYSRRCRQFNRELLAAALEGKGIRYVFLGDELGARRTETECYEKGQAVYHRIAQLPAFRRGLDRLRRGATQYRIALMCAEKEPLDCHRTILICRELRREFQVMHILADGSVEEHTATELRLMQRLQMKQTLFDSDQTDEQRIDEAYNQRAAEIAYRARNEVDTP